MVGKVWVSVRREIKCLDDFFICKDRFSSFFPNISSIKTICSYNVSNPIIVQAFREELVTMKFDFILSFVCSFVSPIRLMSLNCQCL